MHKESEKYLSNTGLNVPRNFLRLRSKNFGEPSFNVKGFKRNFTHTLDNDPLFRVMLIALPVVYGSVHLAARNFKFPSEVEKNMWRVACAIVAGGILAGILFLISLLYGFNVLEELLQRARIPTYELFGFVKPIFLPVVIAVEPGTLKEKLALTLNDFRHPALHLIGWIVVFWVSFVYSLALASHLGARLFIIVESFISVRRLSLGLFITVDWADYMPHL